MFVRVLTGAAVDPIEVRSRWTEWEGAVAADAHGYLGGTAGVADDGTFVAMMRFDSRSAADRASDTSGAHADQWRGMLDAVGRPELRDADRTEVWNRGGSDDAGFVQIRQGTSSDPARLRDLYVNQQPVRMGPFRPEVLGGLFAWHDDTRFTLSAYFTSEDAARRGETLHEFASFFDDINAVMHDLTYIDLRHPWLSSARA